VEAWSHRELCGRTRRLQPLAERHRDIELTFGTPEPLPSPSCRRYNPCLAHARSLGYVSGVRWITVYSGQFPSTGAWHHLAVSYGEARSSSTSTVRAGRRRWERTDRESQCPPFHRCDSPKRATARRGARRTLLAADARCDRRGPHVVGRSLQGRFYPGAKTVFRFFDARALAFERRHGQRRGDSGPNHLDGAIVDAAWADMPSR